MNNQEPKQRVGLFFSNFHGGGIQRVMLRLAEGLLIQGWQVDMIVVNAGGPLKSEIPEGCHLVDFGVDHASSSLFKLSSYLQSSNSPQVLLASQTHLNLVAIIAREISRWKGKLLLSEHVALELHSQNSSKWQEHFYPIFARLFYRLSDGVVLVSEETAKHLLKATRLPEKLVTVIYNPIVSEKMIAQSKGLPDHDWLISTEGPVLLSVGRLTRQKDFPTLLQAFAIVRSTIPSAKLIILGEGEELSALVELSQQLQIQDSLQFAGFVINPFAYMANSSLFVLSSQWEGFGNVLVEAMACGTPVVSTDCPSGPSEILADGKFGLLVPVRDPQALAEAMLLELRNPHKKEDLMKRANDFSVGNIVPQYIKLFNAEQRHSK